MHGDGLAGAMKGWMECCHGRIRLALERVVRDSRMAQCLGGRGGRGGRETIVTMLGRASLPSLSLSRSHTHSLFEPIRYLEMRVRLSALNTLVGIGHRDSCPLALLFQTWFLTYRGQHLIMKVA